MKNVTITLEENVARWVRVWAAEHDTSVSRFLGDLLKKRMQDELEYQDAQRRYVEREATVLKDSGHYPRRDDLHERNLLR